MFEVGDLGGEDRELTDLVFESFEVFGSSFPVGKLPKERSRKSGWGV